MLIRYKTGKNGKPIPQAKVYTGDEHGIDTSYIDYDAVRIARRLRRHGFQAYIVGGAVRDLLIGRIPKDFDMATNAAPGQIRKLFRNSRIIGKRFKLVHIFFHNKIIEVATFRSRESSGFNAVYGSIDEDAERRDFTLNSLYYDTENNQVLDYTGGYEDIRGRVLRPVIPLKRIFTEDPVRMIRAVKYSERTHFKMTFRLRRRLLRSTALLSETPQSRMSEEVFKILASGNASGILKRCFECGLLVHMVPRIDALLRDETNQFFDHFFASMERLDAFVAEQPTENRAALIAFFCSGFFYHVSELGSRRKVPTGELYSEIKELMKPVTPPNRDVETAVHILIRQRKQYRECGEFSAPVNSDPIEEKKHRNRRPRRRRRGTTGSS